LSMANWKVKAQSIIGGKSRSSFNIESSGRSEEDFDLNYERCGNGKGFLTDSRTISFRPPGLRTRRAEV
jgi:hypothetical protein